MIYKRDQSLQDILVSSHFIPQGCRDPCGTLSRGTFQQPCGNRDFCKYILNGNSFVLPTGENLSMQHFVNCDTISIVYLLTCGCGNNYVGKTKKKFLETDQRTRCGHTDRRHGKAHSQALWVCNPSACMPHCNQ